MFKQTVDVVTTGTTLPRCGLASVTMATVHSGQYGYILSAN
jgi:hypothetical protein